MPIIIAWGVPALITVSGCYMQHQFRQYRRRYRRRASIELIQKYFAEGESNNGKIG